jgi:hypothetical protein
VLLGSCECCWLDCEAALQPGSIAARLHHAVCLNQGCGHGQADTQMCAACTPTLTRGQEDKQPQQLLAQLKRQYQGKMLLMTFTSPSDSRPGLTHVSWPALLSGILQLHLRASCRFWTLAEPYTLEVEIKKSRFITSAWPVKTAAEVQLTVPRLSCSYMKPPAAAGICQPHRAMQ